MSLAFEDKNHLSVHKDTLDFINDILFTFSNWPFIIFRSFEVKMAWLWTSGNHYVHYTTLIAIYYTASVRYVYYYNYTLLKNLTMENRLAIYSVTGKKINILYNKVSNKKNYLRHRGIKPQI